MHFNGVARGAKRASALPLFKSLTIITFNSKIQAFKQVLDFSCKLSGVEEAGELNFKTGFQILAI